MLDAKPYDPKLIIMANSKKSIEKKTVPKKLAPNNKAAKKNTARKKTAEKKTTKRSNANFVIVTNSQYGKILKGTKIYFEGKQPTQLKKDGSISFGKNILEIIKRTFPKFRWIITTDTDEIKLSYGIHRVKTSLKTINKMYGESYDRNRDVKEDIILKTFSKLHPDAFKYEHAEKYKPGNISKILQENILNDLSSEDKDELNKFIPDYVAKESVSVVNILKASTQIKTLKEIAQEIKSEIKNTRSESWWQAYIHKNILIIQQGYIQAIEKMNVIIGGTKYPDYSLVTHDGFLDILEIKKPSTPLLKLDPSRDNYYWESEVSKAIIQVENYIEHISRNADPVRSYIKDTYKIDLKVVRPRGIILAGESLLFNNQKQKDDFRLLTQASKNITFVTYDELVTRLENYIEVLERHSKGST